MKSFKINGRQVTENAYFALLLAMNHKGLNNNSKYTKKGETYIMSQTFKYWNLSKKRYEEIHVEREL